MLLIPSFFSIPSDVLKIYRFVHSLHRRVLTHSLMKAQGAFTNYVNMFLAFFEHVPTLVCNSKHLGYHLCNYVNIQGTKAQFSPRNTLAPMILRPNAYNSVWKSFSPKQLRSNTLWPKDQILKCFIFKQLGPSMGLDSVYEDGRGH